MFRRGLYEPGVIITTTPLFVLITLRDPKNGTQREVAIVGPFLLGAIEDEYHIKVRKTGSFEGDVAAVEKAQKREVQIALSQPNRTFVFRNHAARRNVEPRYTPAILQEVRNAFKGKSPREILSAARATRSWLHDIYDSKDDAVRRLAYRDAVAHALLERGILVGEGDVIDGLYVAKGT